MSEPQGSRTISPKPMKVARVVVFVAMALACMCVVIVVNAVKPGEARANSSWSAPVLVDSSGNLNAVSCATTSFCVAVDAGGYSFTYNGTSWQPKVLVSPNSLTGVSCASPSFCMAVDTAGNAWAYTGSSWGGSSSNDSNALIAVSSARAAPRSVRRSIPTGMRSRTMGPGRCLRPLTASERSMPCRVRPPRSVSPSTTGATPSRSTAALGRAH